jgi:hypothetical protein
LSGLLFLYETRRKETKRKEEEGGAGNFTDSPRSTFKQFLLLYFPPQYKSMYGEAPGDATKTERATGKRRGKGRGHESDHLKKKPHALQDSRETAAFFSSFFSFFNGQR